MDFKIDENLPVEAANLLVDAGHNVSTVFDEGLNGHPDSELAAACQTEGRSLITLDLDISDIRTYPPSDYPGIVVLRPVSQAKSAILALLSMVIAMLDMEPIRNRLWIVTRSGVRIRGT